MQRIGSYGCVDLYYATHGLPLPGSLNAPCFVEGFLRHGDQIRETPRVTCSDELGMGVRTGLRTNWPTKSDALGSNPLVPLVLV